MYTKTSTRLRRDFQADGKIELGGFEDLESPIVVSCKTADPQESNRHANTAIRTSFIKGVEKLAPAGAATVILFTNHDLTADSQKQITDKVGGRFHICFQGRDALEDRFRQHPHLLWRYFNWSPYLHFFHSNDSAGLREALVPDELASLGPIDRLRHPKVEPLIGKIGSRLRVTGKPGSGKSAALCQMLVNLPDTEIVVIRSLNNPHTWSHLEEILYQPKGRFALVIDNLHEQLAAHQGIGIFMELSELVSQLESDVSIITAYRSTERRIVEQTIDPNVWSRLGFSELSLDYPPEGFATVHPLEEIVILTRAKNLFPSFDRRFFTPHSLVQNDTCGGGELLQGFISSLVALCCDVLQIEADDSTRDDFTKAIVQWENTAACAVSILKPYRRTQLKEGFFPASLQDRQPAWREAFRALARAGREAEVDVLKSVSALRESGLRNPRIESVEEVFHKTTGRTFGEFEQGIASLGREGRLRIKEELVSGHDIQVMAENVDLVREGEPTPWLGKFKGLLIGDEFSTLREDRVERLHSLTRFYWHIGQFDICEGLCEQVTKESPSDVHALRNRGICRIHLGRASDGVSDLFTALAEQPEDVRTLEALVLNMLRLDLTEQAKEALDKWLEKFPKAPEGLRFATYAFSLLHDKEKSVKCAEAFWKLRQDSLSAAQFADAMASAGQEQESLRFVKDALNRWPESGQLHAAASNAYDLLGDSDEALRLAQRAVQLAPNDPANQAMYAWLLLSNGYRQPAREIVGNAMKIMPNYPDLRALEGSFS